MVVQSDLKSVLTQPFNDFNFVRSEIPEKLQHVAESSYAQPGSWACKDIDSEIVELDQILGADIDKHVSGTGAASEPIIGVENATRTARNAARGAATSWIPFRGFVRELTGAERHARAAREAILAGMLRRAYLKGLRESLAC
ncbi:MAG TPA: hypothetical protein VHT51_19700 [Micropepsaceae bacterium]|jgi:hypothetical protein|nr:hypothetical protein [Micropepsaceae bacterium]